MATALLLPYAIGDRGGAAGHARLGTPGMGPAHMWLQRRVDGG